MTASYPKTVSSHAPFMVYGNACVIAGMLLFAVSGCSGEAKKTEISAASTGFKPADEDTSKASPPPKSPAAEKATQAPAPATNSTAAPPSVPSPNNTSSTPAKPPANSTAATPPTIPTTPALPTFDPKQVDPALAAKSYMKLEMTGSQDPKELMRFLGLIDRSLQEMQADALGGFLNKDQVLDRGMAVSRMKLTAAERLEKVATNPEDKSRALIGKLEALGQMAQFNDVPSADELRVVSKQLANNEDPKVATQALRMQLTSAVIDLKNQASTPEAVVELGKRILEKMDKPDGSLFTSIVQAAKALDGLAAQTENENSTAATDACNELVNALESKFRGGEVPQFGMMSWQMKMQRIPNFKSYLDMLDTRVTNPASTAEVTAAARDLMNKLPSPFTSAALGECAVQFEYFGNTELARNLHDIAAEQLGTAKSAQLKSQSQSAIDGFKARSGAIGKPLPLDSLVDTEGKPLDPARYAGKVVLVDFWASWCAPCIAEIPNIENLYQKQHDAGFEVVAINLDEERAALDAFLAQKKMPWNVYVSSVPDKVGMDTPVAQSLSIALIPFTLLIGRDGNVAAIHIRGPALEAKVEELLSGNAKSE